MSSQASVPEAPKTAPAASAAGGTAPPRDNRWKLVESAMRRHGYRSHALIEALHAAQEAYGFLEEPVLRDVAKALRVPLSKVYGVATFYNFFTLKPQGEHTCIVCTGTACYIKGAGEIMTAIKQSWKLAAGQTTADGRLSLLTARCFGSCGLAPAAVFDGEVAGRLNAGDTLKRIERLVRRDHD